MTTVAVVGASGRLGGALVSRLGPRSAVPIYRRIGEPLWDLAERSASGVDVVVNAAGMAHVARSDQRAASELAAANVDLPVALARACLAAHIPFVHVSSVKASEPSSSEYARSKRDGEDRLRAEFDGWFADQGLSLVIIRPLALLLPPFDAGKLSRLQWLHRAPRFLVPPIPLPVMTGESILAIIETVLRDVIAPGAVPGCRLHPVDTTDRATLRDMRDAFAVAGRS